jgi:hypothetical protein
MRNLTKHTGTVDIISALFILLFVYTSLSKLLEFSSFRNVLSLSPLIGFAGSFLAWLIPAVELVTACLLFLPALRKWGFLLSLILMISFTCYLAYMVLFIPDKPCSCGGVIKLLTWPQHLLLNIIFTLMAGIGLWLNQNTKRFIAINRISRTPV